MVSQFFDEVEFEMNKREFITHVGKFNNKRITVISTGIGTDNIEIFFTELDACDNLRERVASGAMAQAVGFLVEAARLVDEDFLDRIPRQLAVENPSDRRRVTDGV